MVERRPLDGGWSPWRRALDASGDPNGGLSVLSADNRVVGPVVQQSVAHGFGAALAAGVAVAALASALSWLLIRASNSGQPAPRGEAALAATGE